MASYQKLSRPNKKIVACDVYVSGDRKYGGWNIKASKWAIPASLGRISSSEEMHAQYYEFLKESGAISDIPRLAYQTLGCWCDDEEACHSHVLRNLVGDYLSQPTLPALSEEPKLQVEQEPLSRVNRVTFRVVTVKSEEKPIILKGVAAPPIEESIRPVDVDVDVVSPPCQKKLHLLRSIPLSSVVKFPMVFNDPPDEPFFRSEPFNEQNWMLPLEIGRLLKSKKMTPGFIKRISNGQVEAKWPPFICKVIRVIYNKESKRFALEISDGESNIRAEIVSQIFRPLNERFISKEDLIYVSCYSISQHFDILPMLEGDGWNESVAPLAKPKLKKRVVLIAEFYKV